MCLKPLRHDIIERVGIIHLPELGGVLSLVLQYSVVCCKGDEIGRLKLKSQDLYTSHMRTKGGVCPV